MWQTECTRIVKVMINDFSTTPTYDQGRLEELVLVAAQLVQFDLTLAQTYVIDLDQLTLSPDPTHRDTRDDAFINMICIKAACITSHGEAMKSSGQAIAIRDGSSAIDLRGAMSGKLKLLEVGWCKVYDNLKITYQAGNISRVGRAILTPFNYAYGGSSRLEFR